MKHLSCFMQRKRKIIFIISSILFFLYLCLMIWEVFLGPYRSYSGTRRYNVYPFKTIIDYLMNSEQFGFHLIFINLVANIVTFMPLGFFVALLFKRFNNIIIMAQFSILTILSIELIQFIFNVGVFDIDDIILNSLGCIIGFGFYKAIKGFFSEEKG